MRAADPGPLPARIAAVFLLIGVAFGSVVLAAHLSEVRIPGNRQGHEPVQPVAFSHRLHAGEMRVACLYCHPGAEVGAHAGIPSAELCMNCHRNVPAPLREVRAEEARAKAENRPARPVLSPEIAKIYESLALDAALKPVPGKDPRPLEWVRVHQLPAFAKFDHRAHVGAGVDCAACHGPVDAMDRVRQEERLSMGWCVNCHRESARMGTGPKAVKPSIDCIACHN